MVKKSNAWKQSIDDQCVVSIPSSRACHALSKRRVQQNNSNVYWKLFRGAWPEFCSLELDTWAHWRPSLIQTREVQLEVSSFRYVPEYQRFQGNQVGVPTEGKSAVNNTGTWQLWPLIRQAGRRPSVAESWALYRPFVNLVVGLGNATLFPLTQWSGSMQSSWLHKALA